MAFKTRWLHELVNAVNTGGSVVSPRLTLSGSYRYTPGEEIFVRCGTAVWPAIVGEVTFKRIFDLTSRDLENCVSGFKDVDALISTFNELNPGKTYGASQVQIVTLNFAPSSSPVETTTIRDAAEQAIGRYLREIRAAKLEKYGDPSRYASDLERAVVALMYHGTSLLDMTHRQRREAIQVALEASGERAGKSLNNPAGQVSFLASTGLLGKVVGHALASYYR